MAAKKKPKKRVVRAMIFNEANEVLLGRQRRRKLWHFPGGGVLDGKKALRQLIAEIKQETGLVCVRAELICKITSVTLTGIEVTSYYRAEVKSLQTLALRDKKEIDALTWCNLAEENDLELTDTMRVSLWHPLIAQQCMLTK